MKNSNSSFYSDEELALLPFKKCGKNVLISKKASLYNIEKIEVSDYSRIDDFCILSGDIRIGRYVHISAFVALYGGAGIEIKDFSGVSARTTIYSVVDDFSGEFMIGPLVPRDCTNLFSSKVTLEKYCQVGGHSIILPGVTLLEGCVVGASSLVKTSLEAFTINAGVPCKYIKERSKKFLDLMHFNDLS